MGGGGPDAQTIKDALFSSLFLYHATDFPPLSRLFLFIIPRPIFLFSFLSEASGEGARAQEVGTFRMEDCEVFHCEMASLGRKAYGFVQRLGEPEK